MPTTTQGFTVPQAAVLNYLERQPHRGARLTDLNRALPVDDPTIETLAEAERYVRLYDSNDSVTDRVATAEVIRMGSQGRLWVRSDPTNRLLTWLFEAAHGRASLAHIEVRKNPNEIVVAAVERGLMSLHHADDGQETRFLGRGTEFKAAAGYQLRITSTGRNWLSYFSYF